MLTNLAGANPQRFIPRIADLGAVALNGSCRPFRPPSHEGALDPRHQTRWAACEAVGGESRYFAGLR